MFMRAALGHSNHNCDNHFFFSMVGLPQRSTLFPYTTLFRSCSCQWRLSLHDLAEYGGAVGGRCGAGFASRTGGDRKSTRLNSSHQITPYDDFCLKKKACGELVEQRGSVAGECDVHGGKRLGM